MKIKKGQCRCGAHVHLVEQVGLAWTADPKPLDAQEAVQALLAGRELYEVSLVDGKPDKLRMASHALLGTLNGPTEERPIVVASHPCPPGAVRALPATPKVSTVQPTPPGPSVGRTAPSSGPRTGSSSVRGAANPVFKIDWSRVGVRCSLCDKPVDLDEIETYAMFELGAEVIDTFHVGNCP